MALASHRDKLAQMRDGTQVQIAAVTATDGPRLAEAFARLSEESRQPRFLGPKGLGHQLEPALRAAATGHLVLPPRVCELLRALVPLNLRRR
jgi:hypothetical protein